VARWVPVGPGGMFIDTPLGLLRSDQNIGALSKLGYLEET